MQVNWLIIGFVVVFAILLLIFLISKNIKDEEETMDHFNQQDSYFKDDETEFNDEK